MPGKLLLESLYHMCHDVELEKMYLCCKMLMARKIDGRSC